MVVEGLGAVLAVPEELRHLPGVLGNHCKQENVRVRDKHENPSSPGCSMGLLKLRLLRGLAVAPSELIHSNTETVAGLEMSMAEHSWGGEVVKAQIQNKKGR